MNKFILSLVFLFTGLVADSQIIIHQTIGAPHTQVRNLGFFKSDSSAVFDSAYANNGVIHTDLIVGDTANLNTNGLSNLQYGNSETAGTGAVPYTNRTTTLYDVNTGRFEINKAIGGTKLVQLSPGDSSFQNRLPGVPNYNAAIYGDIWVWYGTNDANSGGTDITTFPSVYINCVDTLLLNRGWPASHIILVSPTYGSSVNNPRLKIYTDTIRYVANATGVKYVDLFDYMAANGGLSLVSGDSIHPNNNGYYVAYKKFLLSLTPSQVGEVYTNGFGVFTNSLSVGWKAIGPGIETGAVVANFNGNITTNGVVMGIGSGVPSAQNIGIGRGAIGSNNTVTGADLTAMGDSALGLNTVGHDNTAVGFRALVSNAAGIKNTVIGSQAASHLNGGSGFNTVVGDEAGFGAIGGASYQECSIFGMGAGNALSSGVDNTLVGFHAGNQLTTANFDTEVGAGAGANGTTTAIQNVDVGYNAHISNTNAARCVSIGDNSLSIAQGNDHTAVGHQAGAAVINGHNCFFFGSNAGNNDGVVSTSSTLTNSGAIGQNAQVTQDSSLAIGGLYAQSSAIRIAINGTAPSAYFHIMSPGTAAAGHAPFKIAVGPLITTPESGTMEDDSSYYQTNISGNRYGLGGGIKDFFTDAGNVGTGETDLYTYTTKANTLIRTGEKLKAAYSGTIVGSATASRAIAVYFAGTSIFSATSLTISTASIFDCTVQIIRSGSTTARATVSVTIDGVSLTAAVQQTDLTGLTFSGTNILKITGTSSGTGSATNDIVAKMGNVFWYASANN